MCCISWKWRDETELELRLSSCWFNQNYTWFIMLRKCVFTTSYSIQENSTNDENKVCLLATLTSLQQTSLLRISAHATVANPSSILIMQISAHPVNSRRSENSCDSYNTSESVGAIFIDRNDMQILPSPSQWNFSIAAIIIINLIMAHLTSFWNSCLETALLCIATPTSAACAMRQQAMGKMPNLPLQIKIAFNNKLLQFYEDAQANTVSRTVISNSNAFLRIKFLINIKYQ